MSLALRESLEPIAGYRLIERLGRGGFGEVWKAEAPGGLHKAIKFVFGDVGQLDADGSHRAEQELRSLQRVQAIRHPYLLSIERYDVIEGRLVIVTELADCNLYDRFDHHRREGQPGIPRAEMLRYLGETAEVLDLMNQKHSLQHLDIKPQNLFLIHGHVKVADFGLVKGMEGLRTVVSGGVTPVYAAPETFEGVITPYCDQYSLAIVYQELLTGERPFAATTMQQLMTQHREQDPDLSPLPESDRPAVAKALAKNPEDRYPSCQAFVQALIGKPEVTTPTTKVRLEPSPATVRRAPEAPPVTQRLARTGAAPRPATPPKVMKIRREEILPTVSQQPVRRMAPPEFTGNGVLFPALVIGLGGGGLRFLKALRQKLNDGPGGHGALPNIKLLYLDSDVEAAAQAGTGPGGATLEPDEALAIPANRASHYLKPRKNGRCIIDGWFDAEWLYRIPRQPAVAGVRALGRLVLADHYAAVVDKIDKLLEAVVEPNALLSADRDSSLGVRSNQPRVYIVAGLGGGTGGGGVVDLAYAARRRMRSLGYSDPDVRGLLLAPPVDSSNAAATQVTANAFAALAELRYYSMPDTRYAANFDERGQASPELGPPFSRVVVLPGGATAGSGKRDGARLAADLVARELTQSLGRAIDSRHADAAVSREPSASLVGVAALSWPHRRMLRLAALRLCQKLVERWQSANQQIDDATLEQWQAAQWPPSELTTAPVMTAFAEAVEGVVGGSFDGALDRAIESLTPRGWFGRTIDVEAGKEALRWFDETLGRSEENGPTIPGAVGSAIGDIAKRFCVERGQKLSRTASELIELPEFRLAGADRAVASLKAAVTQFVVEHDRLAKEANDKAVKAYFRIQYVLFGDGIKKTSAAEFVALMRDYATTRLQAQTQRHAAGVCQKFCDDAADQLNEIKYCRQRLEELKQRIAGEAAAPESSPSLVLPPGCKTVDEAIDSLLAGVGEADLAELDQRVNKSVQPQYGTLAQVCLSNTTNAHAGLGAILVKVVMQFLKDRHPTISAAELFLQRCHDSAGADAVLSRAFDEALPPWQAETSTVSEEFRLVSVSGDEPGKRLGELARRMLGLPADSVLDGSDDVVFYRERPGVGLTCLPNMSGAAREAYRQAASKDRTPLHTREDIADWRIPTG